MTGSAALSVLPRPPTAPLPVLALRARRGVPAWVQVSGVSPRCWVPLGALHCAHPVCTPLRPLVSPGYNWGGGVISGGWGLLGAGEKSLTHCWPTPFPGGGGGWHKVSVPGGGGSSSGKGTHNFKKGSQPPPPRLPGGICHLVGWFSGPESTHYACCPKPRRHTASQSPADVVGVRRRLRGGALGHRVPGAGGEVDASAVRARATRRRRRAEGRVRAGADGAVRGRARGELRLGDPFTETLCRRFRAGGAQGQGVGSSRSRGAAGGLGGIPIPGVPTPRGDRGGARVHVPSRRETGPRRGGVLHDARFCCFSVPIGRLPLPFP